MNSHVLFKKKLSVFLPHDLRHSDMSLLSFLVCLPDQKKAKGEELFDQIMYHLDIVEKDYFGLRFMDSAQVPVRLETHTHCHHFSLLTFFLYSPPIGWLTSLFAPYLLFFNVTKCNARLLSCTLQNSVQITALTFKGRLEAGNFPFQ